MSGTAARCFLGSDRRRRRRAPRPRLSRSDGPIEDLRFGSRRFPDDVRPAIRIDGDRGGLGRDTDTSLDQLGRSPAWVVLLPSLVDAVGCREHDPRHTLRIHSESGVPKADRSGGDGFAPASGGREGCTYSDTASDLGRSQSGSDPNRSANLTEGRSPPARGRTNLEHPPLNSQEVITSALKAGPYEGLRRGSGDGCPGHPSLEP